MILARLEMNLQQFRRRKVHLVLILCTLVVVYNLAADKLHNEIPTKLQIQTNQHFEAVNRSMRNRLIPRKSNKEESETTIPLLHERGQHNQYRGIDLMSLPTYKFDRAYKNPCWRENGTLHCLPYFYLIGLKKCGTTELYKLIAKHPDYIIPDGNKEPGWFAEGRFNKDQVGDRIPNSAYPYYNFDSYIAMFNNVAERIDSMHKQQLNEGTAPCQLITGDGSTSNIHLNTHWPYLPGNEGVDEPRYVVLDYIHHFLPKAKIIVMFRDPVERLYSDYFYRFVVNRENFTSSPEHFHKEASAMVLTYRNCFKIRTVRSCAYDDRIRGAIRVGIYIVYWQDLVRVFPREQILIVHKEDLQDMRRVLHRVFKFLEMRMPDSSEWNLFVSTHRNSRRPEDVDKGDMLNETRVLLEDFYRPFNEEMFRVTGDKTFLYNGKQ